MTTHHRRFDGSALCNRKIKVEEPPPGTVPSCRSCLRILARQRTAARLLRPVFAAVYFAIVFMGCGGEPLQVAEEQPAASLRGCVQDGGWLKFKDTVTVQQDGDAGTCEASYTVDGGVNTFLCPCAEPTACTAAFDYLTAEAHACGFAGS